MISIKECNKEWVNIKKVHVTTIQRYIHDHTDFFLDLLKYVQFLQVHQKTRNTTVNSKITTIGKKYDFHGKHTTYLVNKILQDKFSVNDKNEYYSVKYKDKYKIGLRPISDYISGLDELKGEIDWLVSFSAPIDKIHYVRTKLLCDSIESLLPAIINYDHFSKGTLGKRYPWNAYRLSKALNLKTCCYCNREYTFTITSGKKNITRPELDHFYDKAKNHLLALSFENLIPSCDVCNGDLKNQADFINDQPILNPYEENQKHAAMQFKHYPKTYEAAVGLTDEFDIEVVNCTEPGTDLSKKVDRQISLFRYNGIYPEHGDYIQDLVMKKWVSNDKYLALLKELYIDFELTPEEAYRLAFGNFQNEEDFGKRPLSKMTKDIAQAIGLIKKHNGLDQ